MFLLQPWEKRNNEIERTTISPVNDPESSEVVLLIVVIVLGILNIIFISIILYGCKKYVIGNNKKKIKNNNNNTVEVKNENVNEKASVPDHSRILETLPEEPELPSVTLPKKMRKRSMTFTETDNECRKYRETLADTFTIEEKAESETSDTGFRRKSVVTFVGIE